MDEKFIIVYSSNAVNDLQIIHDYIGVNLKSVDTAYKQVKRIRDRVDSLEFMPKRHKLVEWEPWNSLDIHQVVVDNYVIFYKVDNKNKTVSIVRIFYGGRNIEEIIKNS